LEARRDGAGAAGGDTAGEHVGGGIGRREVFGARVVVMVYSG
jgi:hypothetical protein